MAKPLRLQVNLPTVADPTVRPQPPARGGAFRLRHSLPAIVIASKVIATTTPVGVVINTAFSLTVNAVDPSNTLVSTYSSSATVTKASGPGTLTGTLTASFSGGILTFSNLLLDTIGTYTLTISSGSLTPGTTSSFTVTVITTLLNDTFAHAFGTANTGQTWTTDSGTFTSDGVSVLSTTAASEAHITGATAGTITEQITTGKAGMIPAYQDATHYISYEHDPTVNAATGVNTGATAFKIVNGGTTTKISNPEYYPPSGGNLTPMLKIVRVGNGTHTRYFVYRKFPADTNYALITIWSEDTFQAASAIGIITQGAASITGPLTMTDATSGLSATPAAYYFACDGNSLTLAQGAATEDGRYVPQMIGLVGTQYDYSNWGVGAIQTPGMQSAGAAGVFATFAPAHAKSQKVVYLMWEGGNHIVLSSVTAQVAHDAYVSLAQAARAAGADYILAFTLADRSTILAATKNSFNSLVVASWRGWADGLVRLDQNTHIGPDGANANTTYFLGDGVHHTSAGYTEVALSAQSAISALLIRAAASNAFAVSSNTLPISATAGGSSVTGSVNVYQTGGPNQSYTVASSQSWLTASNGSTPNILTITVNPASLTNGTYTGTITATPTTGSAQVVTVTATVSGGTTIIAADTFNKTDNATSVGTTTTGSFTWANWVSTCGINTNKAYTSDGSLADHIAAFDAGVADCTVSVTLSTFSGNTAAAHGIVTRGASSSSYILLAVTSGGTVHVYTFNGSYSSLSTTTATMTPGDVWAITTNGTAISVTQNGTHLAALDATSSFNQTSTFTGIYFAVNDQRSDDFQVTVP